ncbi:MAG: helical backbone metal receptor [Endomicrobiia bacterium]
MKNLYLLVFTYSLLLSSTNYKIISLTPSITETLYLLGETKNVVGITSFCKRISKEQRIVGTYIEPNIEEIIKINPDIVFISKEGTKKETVEKLKKFNINVVIFEPVNNYKEIKYQFLYISKILKKEKTAKDILRKYEASFRQKTKKYTGKKILCILSLNPLIVASDKSYIGDIIKNSGGINPVISQIKYPSISLEELLKINPEIIIIPEMGINKKEIERFFIRFKNLNAAKNNRIYVLPSDVLCQPNVKNYFLSVQKISKILEEK